MSYSNGQRIAMRSGGTLTYLHSDHLGSVALTTNGGTIEQQYYAYGRKRGGGSLPTDHTYTGQKQDASGLLYYHARYYDPQLGTFISPDTLVPELSVLFDYNRYLYVRGNPLRYSDPSGHVPYSISVRSFAPFEWFGGGFNGNDRGYSTASTAGRKWANVLSNGVN